MIILSPAKTGMMSYRALLHLHRHLPHHRCSLLHPPGFKEKTKEKKKKED